MLLTLVVVASAASGYVAYRGWVQQRELQSVLEATQVQCDADKRRLEQRASQLEAWAHLTHAERELASGNYGRTKQHLEGAVASLRQHAAHAGVANEVASIQIDVGGDVTGMSDAIAAATRQVQPALGPDGE